MLYCQTNSYLHFFFLMLLVSLGSIILTCLFNVPVVQVWFLWICYINYLYQFYWVAFIVSSFLFMMSPVSVGLCWLLLQIGCLVQCLCAFFIYNSKLVIYANGSWPRLQRLCNYSITYKACHSFRKDSFPVTSKHGASDCVWGVPITFSRLMGTSPVLLTHMCDPQY